MRDSITGLMQTDQFKDWKLVLSRLAPMKKLIA
jgi:hypothetical protein